jgi:hypothetical protein
MPLRGQKTMRGKNTVGKILFGFFFHSAIRTPKSAIFKIAESGLRSVE